MCLCVALVEYKNISGKTLQQSIEGEMSGDLEELLVAIGRLQCLLMSFYLCINAVFNHIVVHNFSHYTSEMCEERTRLLCRTPV